MTRARRRLVIMVKEPAVGRVKTRLGRDIGPVRATNFYRHNLSAVTARLSCDNRWQTILSVAPATAVLARSVPTDYERWPQAPGGLGARMQAIFDMAVSGPTVVIGTDIPEVHPAHIWAAFRALGSHDMVFGPATDGGFWLVGMRRTPRVVDAFRDVRWSAPETLQDCRDGLAGCRVATAATLLDIDDADDFRTLGAVAGRRILPAIRLQTKK